MIENIEYVYLKIDSTIDFRIFSKESSDVIGCHFTDMSEMLDVEEAHDPVIYMLYTNDMEIYIGVALNGIVDINPYYKNESGENVYWDYCKMFISESDLFDDVILSNMRKYYIDQYELSGEYDVSYDNEATLEFQEDALTDLNLVSIIREINLLMRVERDPVLGQISARDVSTQIDEYLSHNFLSDLDLDISEFDDLDLDPDFDDSDEFSDSDNDEVIEDLKVDYSDEYEERIEELLTNFFLDKKIEIDTLLVGLVYVYKEEVKDLLGENTTDKEFDELMHYLESMLDEHVELNDESPIEYFYPKDIAYQDKAKIYFLEKEYRPPMSESGSVILESGSVIQHPSKLSIMYSSENRRYYDRIFDEMLEAEVLELTNDGPYIYKLLKPYAFDSISTVASIIIGQDINGMGFFAGLDYLQKDHLR